jgi:hypothetical protein
MNEGKNYARIFFDFYKVCKFHMIYLLSQVNCVRENLQLENILM